MKELSHFANTAEYQIMGYAINFLVLSEIAIIIFSMRGSRGAAKKPADRGTFYLIAICWCVCLVIGASDYYTAGQLPFLLLPHFIYYIGIFFIIGGVLLRAGAVLTLKKAFTLSVQTTDEQHLIQSGLYRLVRNPAYSGSILSLLGVALGFRSPLNTLAVLVLCLICYSIRIRVEERALKAQFPEEFLSYCKHTRFRLIPWVY